MIKSYPQRHSFLSHVTIIHNQSSTFVVLYSAANLVQKNQRLRSDLHTVTSSQISSKLKMINGRVNNKKFKLMMSNYVQTNRIKLRMDKRAYRDFIIRKETVIQWRP